MSRRIKNLSRKRVLITGAASGIGYAMCLAFAREGADIIATDLNQAGLDELAHEVALTGRECLTEVLDVRDDEAFDALAARLRDAGQLPDIVVNNAGIGFMAGFSQTSRQMWQDTLDVNVIGVANGCRAFLPALLEAKRPALLVNVSSAASFGPLPNMSAYAASKWAVEGLCEVLAMELQDRPVGVICVHPGIINTPIVDHPARAQVPMERLQKLQEFYRTKGTDPADVALAVVAAVRSGKGTVNVGLGARSGAVMKRLLPRKLLRFVLAKTARDIGYA